MKLPSDQPLEIITTKERINSMLETFNNLKINTPIVEFSDGDVNYIFQITGYMHYPKYTRKRGRLLLNPVSPHYTFYIRDAKITRERIIWKNVLQDVIWHTRIILYYSDTKDTLRRPFYLEDDQNDE